MAHQQYSFTLNSAHIDEGKGQRAGSARGALPLEFVRTLLHTIANGCEIVKTSRPRRALRKLSPLLNTLRAADAFFYETYTAPRITGKFVHREVAQIHQQAYVVLADGYLHIFDQEWDHVTTHGHNSNDALDAATLVLNCLKNSLLVSFLANEVPPEDLWLRAHHVFHRITSAPLKWTQQCSTQVETVLNLYKHIMLLGIAQPSTLTPHEVLWLDRELKTLAPHAHILPAQVEWDKQHVFLIHTAHDTAPVRDSHSRNFGDTQLWLIDIRDVATRFRLLHHAQKPSATHWAPYTFSTLAPTHLSPTKIEQLTRAWQTGERRAHPRESHPRRLWITLGLIHTFDALCATTQNALITDIALDSQTAATQRAEIWRAAQPHPVTLHSSSAAGLGLHWQTLADAAEPQIGKLMGIFTNGDAKANSLLALGVVSWARPRGNNAWACGVQIISEAALPLVFEPYMGETQQPSLLLLPQGKMPVPHARLVTLAGNPPQCEARVSDGRHAQLIRLDDTTIRQAQFECHEFVALHTEHTLPAFVPPSHVASIMITEDLYNPRETPLAVR